MCSKYRRPYLKINGIRNLDFIILTKKKQLSRNLIENVIGYSLTIMVLYLMFWKYIAKSFVRKMFFGKTTLIWYNEMPSPEKLLLFIDGIRMSRIQDDLVREDLLHYKLVDFIRNPETMYRLGDSKLNRRVEIDRNMKKEI